nr:aldehyde dehydrogenase family protein [Kiritimatiellia bacterium]
DLDRAVRVARALETGNVSINNALATQANSALPFGGVKDSGFGRYKGTFGLYSFCNVKSVLLDKGTLGPDLHWHPYSREKYALFSRLLEAFYRDTKPAWLRLSLLVFNLMRLNRRG